MSTSAKPKLNYKGVLLAPAPPVPKVEIFSPDANPLFSPILYDCIGHVTESNYKEYDVGPVMRPVVEFEGEELQQYNQKKGIFYQKLKGDMEWLSKKLKKNIFVYIGHVEDIDRKFIPKLNYNDTTGLSTLTPEFETICILIACYSTDNAQYINNYRQYFVGRILEKQFHFMCIGFEHLVHIYRGEIYMCEKHHEKLDSFQCMYPNALYDKQNLLADVDGKSNPLYRCCKVKYDRFKSRFVDELSTRDCIKLTKEKLYEKLEKLIVPSTGKLATYVTANKYTIESSDGEKCPSSGCTPKNPYKGAVPIAESFDKGEEITKLAAELYEMIYNRKESENVILNRIQSIPPEKRDVLYTNLFILPNSTILHELLFWGNFKVLNYCAKHYTIPLYRVGPYGMNLIIMGSSMDNYNETKMLEFFDNLVQPSDDYDVIEFLRYDRDESANSALFYMATLGHVRLVEWYLHKTRPWANINDQSGYRHNDTHMPIFNKMVEEGIYNPYIWRLLLVHGADPIDRQSGTILTAMELILHQLPHPFPSEIVYLLCIFGYPFVEPIEKTIEHINSVLKNTSHSANQRKIMSDCIDSLKRCLKIIASSPERKRKMRSKITQSTVKELDDNIALYQRRIKAHEELPKLYGMLDKTLKKPGVKLSKENKKTLRNRGLALLKNNAQNIMLRLESLEAMIDAVSEPTNGAEEGGSRRFKKTRKQLR